jgi:hypothetical protein
MTISVNDYLDLKILKAVARWAEEDGVQLADLEPKPKPRLITNDGRVVEFHGRGREQEDTD